MTHQEILDAWDSIYSRAHEASKIQNEWIDAERARLRGECAKVGHLFGRDRGMFSSDDICVICGESKP